MEFIIDKQNVKVTVVREFAARPEKVWEAWTDSRILDQWWAPRPWKAETKSMEFKTGGYWLYAMVGPEGEKHWSRADFLSIDRQKSFSGRDAFCDSEGNVNPDFPASEWHVGFEGHGDITIVRVEIRYDKLADLEKYIEMGFKEGFTSALGNLDGML